MRFLIDKYTRSFEPSAGVFIIVCVTLMGLALYNLDNAALWYDEAQTAFVAKGVLDTGWPTAHDGRQLIPEVNVFYNENMLWVEHPWLQFYIVAMAFKLFGVSPVTARLFFVLIGFCTVFFLYRTVHRVYGTGVARLSSVLLLLSTPYMLHLRQCRYYAILGFATVWMLWAYLKFERGERGALPHLIAAAVLTFYCNVASFFALMAGITLWIVVKGRYAGRWRALITMYGVIFVFTFPWFIFADLMSRRDTHGSWSVLDMISQLGYYTVDINAYLFPVVFLVLLSVFNLRQRLKRYEIVIYLSIPIVYVGHTIVAGLPNPPLFLLALTGGILFLMTAVWGYRMVHKLAFLQPVAPLIFFLVIGGIIGLATVIPIANFRYLVGYIPLICILAALLLYAGWQRSRTVGIIVGALFIGTNILHALPLAIVSWLPVSFQNLELITRAAIPPAMMERITGRSQDQIYRNLGAYLASVDSVTATAGRATTPYFDYIYEVTQPRKGSVEGVVAYLQKHARPGETIFSDSDRLALVFHTDLKLKSYPITAEKIDADWVSLRPHSFYEHFSTWWIRNFYDEVLTPFYDKIELDYPDVPNIDYNQPSPRFHEFYPDSEDYPRMVVFRRKKGLPSDDPPSR